ncbi:MAG: VOC family protein [Chloroflexi bacterium]|nr:VOC family protein [Chloroflexota bacterium]
MDWKLEVVVVPVSDVDRAKAFYAEQLGFPVDVDSSPSPGFRVVQMTPQGSGCSVTIGTGLTKMAPGSLEGLQLCVADIEAAHAELAERGVAVSPIQHHDGTGFVDGKGEDWNSFFFFRDPDGNGWAVQESPTMRAATPG